jgi:hypothetical protein
MIPEYSVAGRMVSTAVPKMAAIWLRMKVEISSPTAVAEATYKQRCDRQGQETPRERHAEHGHCQQGP